MVAGERQGGGYYITKWVVVKTLQGQIHPCSLEDLDQVCHFLLVHRKESWVVTRPSSRPLSRAKNDFAALPIYDLSLSKC